MAYTITNLKDELSAMLHGTTLDSVSNITGLINRAARQVISEVDFFELKRPVQITNGVYDDVFDYAAPSDLKMNKIIDIRKQANREESDNFSQTYSELFDMRKVNNSFTVEYRNTTKVLRIAKDIGSPVTIEDVGGVSVNGTWSVGGDATNITTDNVNFISGSASINFDLSGATTSGFVQNSTFTAVDLSTHEDQSSLFGWFFFPDASTVTSVELRWGSDTSNYWSRSVTQANFGAFVTGWNQLRFDWNGATQTASPSSSAVDFLRATITYDGVADTDYRLDKITSSLSNIFDLIYYTEAIFQDTSATTFKTETTSDDDIVVVEAIARNGLLFKCAEFAAQQVQAQGGSIDVGYFANEYEKWKQNYRRNYKSESIKPQTTYYRVNRRRGGSSLN